MALALPTVVLRVPSGPAPNSVGSHGTRPTAGGVDGKLESARRCETEACTKDSRTALVRSEAGPLMNRSAADHASAYGPNVPSDLPNERRCPRGPTPSD